MRAENSVDGNLDTEEWTFIASALLCSFPNTSFGFPPLLVNVESPYYFILKETQVIND